VSKDTLIYELYHFDIAAAQSAASFRVFAISEQKRISHTVLYKNALLTKTLCTRGEVWKSIW